MADYLPIFVMLILAVLFAAFSFAASSMLSPRRATAAKEAPYECGIVPRREPPERFPVRFYLVAMIFIVFDIEIIFLFPWAVLFHQQVLAGARHNAQFLLIEIAVFAFAAFVPFLYLVSKGALDWGPVRRLRPNIASPPDRTTDSTVARVSSSQAEVA